MARRRNLILATDSYKQSHYLQYPPETRGVSAYIEARDNDYSPHTVFFGLQAFIKEYLMEPVTRRDVYEAQAVCSAHGVPFNEQGWMDIVERYDGFLPIEIKALPEGTYVPNGVPMVQVTNTDDCFPWLVTFIETALLRSIWYTSTVATASAECKRIILSGLITTSEDPYGQIPFKLHDFGARGVSSSESAGLGGMAHLVNFMGTDTMEGLLAAQEYYGAIMAGFSIPAAEHSTMTAWGRDREVDAYRNMITQFGGKDKLVAVVSDSYDIESATDSIWGCILKEEVLASGGTVVVRPDSGDPVETPYRVIESLGKTYGVTINSKGYKVLHPSVRVIQGDGMTVDTIKQLVDKLIRNRWSIDNIAFGMGGGLLQHANRDTMRFAMKANAIRDAKGNWHDVWKSPASDPTKGSKAGRQAVIYENNVLTAVRLDDIVPEQDQLQAVFNNGILKREVTFGDVRDLVEDELNDLLEN